MLSVGKQSRTTWEGLAHIQCAMGHVIHSNNLSSSDVIG